MLPSSLIAPAGVNLEDLIGRLRILSWEAADILMAYARGEQPPFGFSKDLKVKESKEGPVSAADLAVNTWLLNGLKSSFPSASWGMLSEETQKDQPLTGPPLEDEWLWILDPLDGTKDFLQGTGDYAVHLALVRRNTPVLGVVLIPEAEELWFGIVGVGSWSEDRNGVRKSPQFSQRVSLNELTLIASKNHRGDALEQLIQRVPFAAVKAAGSVGCKVASILRGESDLYISLSGKSAPKDWDIAAPAAILIAAGGKFTHADGKVLEYNTGDLRQSGCLIATHGKNHKQLCLQIYKELVAIKNKQ